MAMNLRPLGNRLVVKATEDEEMTASGIILPETAKEKPQKGIVLAAGPGLRLESGERQAMSVSVGDNVLFGKYVGTEIKLEDQDVLILREDDVLAIIE